MVEALKRAVVSSPAQNTHTDWDVIADRVLGHVYEIEKERLKEDPEENPVIVLAALRLLEDRFKGSIDCDEHFRTRLLRYADTVKPSSYKLPRTI